MSSPRQPSTDATATPLDHRPLRPVSIDTPVAFAINHDGNIDDAPAHLDVCDDVMDVLEVVGATPSDASAPTVSVRCSSLPRETQRNTLKKILRWPGAYAFAGENGGNRVFVSFTDRPQLRVEFLAQAVGQQHFENTQVARWHVDKSLLPEYRQALTEQANQ